MYSSLFAMLQAYLKRSNSVGWSLYEQADQFRRWLGKQLDAVGLGPVETSFQVVFTEPGVTLRYYGGDGVDSNGPVLLIVPAPIKRAYIWDLVPWASAVQKCLRSGLRVYLIHWEQPGEHARGFGLAEYADQLILDCLQVIQAETGQRQAFLTGHSLGGTFAAIFAALHPDRVKGLILLEAPLHFGPHVSAFGPLVAAAPRAQVLTKVLGNVPGSFLSAIAFLAAPGTFGWSRGLDQLRSLPDVQALQTHLRVERWALDELPLAQQLFEEVVELLYREDHFMRGTLMIRGRRAVPELVDVPLLSVVDPRSTVVPPQAVLPFHQAVRSPDTKILWYEGDTGVSLQHLGVLVGRNAHQHLWPEILRWIDTHQGGG
jgi:polyhydroxyalkanoate synthase